MFDGAVGVNVKAVDDILARMWMKWVMFPVLAGMTCLMRANIGEIVRMSQGRAAMAQFLDGNLLLAEHYGYPLDVDSIANARSVLPDATSTTTTFMLRDLERCGRIEGEHILGDLLAYANRTNIDHPLLTLAYAHVKAYETRLSFSLPVGKK